MIPRRRKQPDHGDGKRRRHVVDHVPSWEALLIARSDVGERLPQQFSELPRESYVLLFLQNEPLGIVVFDADGRWTYFPLTSPPDA